MSNSVPVLTVVWTVSVLMAFTPARLAGGDPPGGNKPVEKESGTGEKGAGGEPVPDLAACEKKLERYRQELQFETVVSRCADQVNALRAKGGNELPGLIESLKTLAMVHERFGDFESAVKVRKEVLTLVTRRHGEKGWQTLTAKLDLKDAETRTSLDAARRLAMHESYRMLVTVMYHKQQGELANAIRAADGQRQLIAQAVGKHTRDYAAAALAEVVCRMQKKDAAKALPLAEEAANILAECVGRDHPQWAEAECMAAYIRLHLNSWPGEMTALRDAQKVLAGAGQEVAPQHAMATNVLGAAYMALSDYPAAARELAEATRVYRRLTEAARDKRGGDDDPVVIEYRNALCDALSNLGGTQHQLGDYPAAFEQYRAVLKEYERLPRVNPLQRGVLSSNMAALHVELNDPASALALYQQAEKDLKGGGSLQYAQVLNNLGLLYARHPQLDEAKGGERAEQCLQAAIALRRKLLAGNKPGADHPDVARTRTHLGNFYARVGRLPEAEEELRAAFTSLQGAYPGGHQFVDDAANDLGFLMLRTSRTAEALPLLERAAESHRKRFGDRHPWFLNMWNNTALALWNLGRRDEGGARERQVFDGMVSVRDGSFEGLSRRQRVQLSETHRAALGCYLSITEGVLPTEERYAGVVRMKGYLTAREEAERAKRDHPNAAKLTDDYLSCCARLKWLAAKVERTGDERAAEGFRQLGAEKERLEQELNRLTGHFRDYGFDVGGRVSAALPPDAALVDYVQYTHATGEFDEKGKLRAEVRVRAFVVRQGRPVAEVDLGPVGLIATAVDAWRKSVEENEAGKDKGTPLAGLVWERVREHLGGATVVFIAADGPLCALPFAALPDSANGDKPLIERYAFAHLTSARELLEKKPVPRTGRAYVALSPDYGPLPGNNKGHRPLRDGGPSVRTAIDQLVGHQNPPRTGLEATAVDFRESFKVGGAKAYRYIHLETHAFWRPVEGGLAVRPTGPPTLASAAAGLPPLATEFDTGLAFARANETPAGVLTGEELAALDLRGVDVVFLSACSSARGRVMANEGPLSLQRAFRAAGARTLVAALWDVPEDETRELAAEFYRQLAELGEERKLDALRNAQLAVLRKPGANPYHWAAWVMSGDPGEVTAVRPAEPGTLAASDPDPASTERPPAVPAWVWWAAGGLVLVALATAVPAVLATRRRTTVSERAGSPPPPPPAPGS